MLDIRIIFIILALFQIKHFLADYILQNEYMLGKFKSSWAFFLPLLLHSGVHGLFTLTACLLISPNLWWLSIVDMCIHFVMDRIKAGPKYLGRFKPLNAKQFKRTIEDINYSWNQKSKDLCLPEGNLDLLEKLKKHHSNIQYAAKKRARNNTFFWWALGFDQMIHHLTDLFIVYYLCT